MSKIFKTFKNVWHVIKEVLRFHWMLQSRRRWKCFYRCRIKYNPCCQTADFYSKASHLMREVWLCAEMHLICKVHEKGLGRPCLKHQPLLSLYQLSFYQPCLRGDSLLEQSWFWGARREEAGAWYSGRVEKELKISISLLVPEHQIYEEIVIICLSLYCFLRRDRKESERGS